MSSSKWLKTGDQVVVLAGNEKGQTGKILAIHKGRVVVEGLNIRKKHVKPKQKMQPGIVEMEGSIDLSNVSICTDEGKAVKIKVKQDKSGEKQLVYLQGGKEVVYRDVKKKK